MNPTLTPTKKQIGRRAFLGKLLKSLQLIPAASVAGPVLAAASAPGDTSDLHYTPLNGKTLTDIAKYKMHHGNGRFHNPFGIPRNGRFLELLRWKFFSFNDFSEHLDDQPVIPLKVNWDPVKSHGNLSITYLKHAGLLIKDTDRHLLVDPVFEGLFWFIDDYMPLGFDPKDMPRPDNILITHGHYDHLDLPSLQHFPKDTHIISPLGYPSEFEELGMRRRTQLDWLDTYRDKQLEITLLPCNHWTMRSPIEGPNTSLWGSYLIRTRSGYTIYISGDTAYFDGFEQIGNTYDIDLAIINLGAYEPRWFMAPSHMNPEETVRAFKALKAEKLMIAHWGAFQLGDEPVHFPPLDMRKAMAAAGLADRLIDLKQGETYFPG